MSQAIPESTIAIEKALVSACVLEPDVFPSLAVDSSDFITPLYRRTWETMQELTRTGQAWDPVVLLDLVPKFDLGAIDVQVSGSMAPQYATRLAESAAKRRLRIALAEGLGKENGAHSASEWLSEVYRLLGNVSMPGSDSTHTVGQAVKDRYAQLAEIAEARATGDVAATGIPTGIDKLDETLGGIQRGIVTLVAARPAMGKSTLALTFARTASELGIGTHKFSLEEPRDAYADRVLCAESGVASTQAIRAVTLSKSQMYGLQRAGERMVRRKHWLIDDRSGITAEDLVCAVRRHRVENETQLVIVDYISLLRGPSNFGGDKRRIIDHNINVLADAAKQDQMAYVVLAQLNRNLENRDDKRPMLSDLKESGTLEERAKAIVMLYRDAVYNKDADQDAIEIIVNKNSQGKTGFVNARWVPEKMRIQ